MKKFLTIGAFFCATLMNAQGVYQIPNSDFENWIENKEPGNGWNSFASADGSFSGTVSFLGLGAEQVSGYNSSLAVKLKSKSAFGQKANGNLTTGQIHMGSMSPAGKENYNGTVLTNSSHCLLFAGTPDAVSCMAKFKSGGSPNGRGQFILHDKYEYKDPESSNDAGYESHKIALAAIMIPEASDWTYFEAKFDYTGNVAPAGEQYMLASFTTNPEPGGSANDELTIDDVRLIYYSELKSLNYDGIEYFQEGVANYTIDAVYDESKLFCTSNGKGATIDKPSYDEETGVLTITVKGNDVSVNPTNVHTYTVQFKTPVVTTYTNSLLVNAFGNYAEPTENSIDLIKEVDDSYSFQLKNFAFGGMPMGDIKIVNLNREENGDAVIYSADNQMVYIEGLDAELPITLNATQKGDELTADIHITLGPGMNVDVTFLPALTINGEDKLTASAERYNVTMNRTFAQGWSTICLPFATTPAALGASSVQELASADDNGLNFAEVETLEANKPYLVYFDAAKDVPAYFPVEIASTTPVAVTKGDYTFVGSYEASISMSGKYGVATIGDEQKITLGGANSTLKATRAYFTKAGEQPAQVRINLYTSATTGIDQMENNGAQLYDVYSLQGVQVLKGATSLDGLKKGIYIVNGKKMVIK